ncbi:hypothetical protein HI113_03085 [Corallococcus exiguus]|uniref:hypothetical protein n=1 Tax=Corallococcus TaxID=83461 RepID=UPI000EEA97DC|nr:MULTISPECIES: hypothetical protein [Corallococcus]NNB92896.1 hypothetical protein [Corallococcus exiguus]NPC45848.1 hypothetical protein [Corallococcus exiguus]RKH83324.1 hypothetical protein D7X99_12990 [Corallococcus sp. AB032C]
MRILKWLLGGVALLLGGAFVWGRQHVSAALHQGVEKLTGGTLMAEFFDVRRPFVPFANASGAV